MDGREEKLAKYLYQKHDDALLVSYADKKNLEKKHCCPFNNAFKLRKMSDRNLIFIRFIITQKGELMWLILYLLINLNASNLPDGR